MSATLEGCFWAPEAAWRLTLGDALRLQVEIWLEPISPLEAVPELMTVAIVAV